MSESLATVGILSIGDMGLGVAKLLVAHKYDVVTNVSGRSRDTENRAQEASVKILPTDEALVEKCDFIISIVPPRDAFATAERISTAIKALSEPRKSPLFFLDLNAISPRSARAIAALFPDPKACILLDGAIIGGPPSLKIAPFGEVKNQTTFPDSEHRWNRPSIPLSGPDPLTSAPRSGAHLAVTLNSSHISSEIGSASGLKCCFATTTKGMTALCIQAFTTAASLGVLDELKKQMSIFAPSQLHNAERAVPAMCPKAYRWVREMEEIGECHADEGGFADGLNVFNGVAEIYRVVADETVLGEEKITQRKRGRTVEDVAVAIVDGLEKKRKKTG